MITDRSTTISPTIIRSAGIVAAAAAVATAVSVAAAVVATAVAAVAAARITVPTGHYCGTNEETEAKPSQLA